jgi:hypothetical protein
MTNDEINDFFSGKNRSQGAKAVRSGQSGEQMLEAMFKTFKVSITRDDRGYHNDGQLWPHKKSFVVRQFQLDNCQEDYCVDYMYMGFPGNLRLPIEVKSQYGSGTTDEKLLYTANRLVRAGYPAFWIVVFGQSFRREIVSAVNSELKKLGRGRLIYGEQSLLFRAIEQLVDKGKP